MTVNPVLEILDRYRRQITVPLHGRFLAVGVMAAGMVLVIVFVIAGSAAPVLVPLSLWALIAFWGGASISRRLWLADAFTLLSRDKRAPVLYLRSFAFDDSAETPQGVFNVPFSRTIARRRSLESSLCPMLKSVGPVLTFGRRTDILNVATACRIKVSEAAWKDLLAELMTASSLLLLDAGKSKSLLWELRHGLSEKDRKKFVIALPTGTLKSSRDDDYGYMAIRNEILEITGFPLPRFQDDVAFIWFNEKGEPIPERIAGTLSLPSLFLGRTRATFAKVLRGLGYSPRPYRLRTYGILRKAAVVAGLILALLSYGVYESDHLNAQIRQFARAEGERRKTLGESIREMKNGRMSNSEFAAVLTTRVLPQLKSDHDQLQIVSLSTSLMSSNTQIVTTALLRYSSAEVGALESLTTALQSSNSKKISAALEKLSEADTLLAGVPQVGNTGR